MTLTIFKRAAKLLFLFVAYTYITLVLTACSDSTVPFFKLSGATMGTTYNITIVEPDGVSTDQQKLQLIINTRLDTLNQQMSTYIDDSELSYLNRTFVDEPFKLSSELFDVLMLSTELSWLSNGAFDASVGPLVDLWGFGPGSNEATFSSIPAQSSIDSALQSIGYQYLQFNIADNSVIKLKPVSIDLSGIAKGYGVDKVSELLLAAGYKNFMVEIGGELRLEGISPKLKPWKIAIEQPDGTFGNVHSAVNVSGAAMATSGDYRNYFEKDGKRYSHTIDPTTGRPITHNLASVTVMARSSAYADGLATAINVMGAKKGYKLAKQQNLAVYLIIKTDKGFEAKFTDAFRPYMD